MLTIDVPISNVPHKHGRSSSRRRAAWTKRWKIEIYRSLHATRRTHICGLDNNIVSNWFHILIRVGEHARSSKYIPTAYCDTQHIIPYGSNKHGPGNENEKRKKTATPNDNCIVHDFTEQVRKCTNKWMDYYYYLFEGNTAKRLTGIVPLYCLNGRNRYHNSLHYTVCVNKAIHKISIQ